MLAPPPPGGLTPPPRGNPGSATAMATSSCDFCQSCGFPLFLSEKNTWNIKTLRLRKRYYLFFIPCRKKSILLSHVFVFVGAALATACQAATAPELLMIGRFLFGVNNGKPLIQLNQFKIHTHL